MVIWGSSRSKSGFATEKSEYSTSAAKFRVKTSLFKEKNVMQIIGKLYPSRCVMNLFYQPIPQYL